MARWWHRKLIINHTDPEVLQDEQFSSYKVPHPHFKELKVRQALVYAIQRDAIATQLYGPGGKATGYTMNENSQYMPAGITWEFNLDRARQLLDEVGAQPGPDGIRVLNGRRMAWLSTASTNSVRQKEQEIIKSALPPDRRRQARARRAAPGRVPGRRLPGQGRTGSAARDCRAGEQMRSSCHGAEQHQPRLGSRALEGEQACLDRITPCGVAEVRRGALWQDSSSCSPSA